MLAPFAFEGPLSLRLLSDFLKQPARAFFQLRLGIHFDGADVVAADHEPFALDALQNWKLQDELVRAQRAALDHGRPREDVLRDGLARMARSGVLPAGPFGELTQEALGEPMEKMFETYVAKQAAWPETLVDESLDWLGDGLPESLRLVDWLDGMRANAAGERCRLVLDSRSMVSTSSNGKRSTYQQDKLVASWVAHLAGHLAGRPMTTVVVNKTGSVTLMPLDIREARVHWDALCTAWQRGMRRPLPLALKTSFEWLEKDAALQAGKSTEEKVMEAARARYEDDEPQYFKHGERAGSAYLARAFPDFAALWRDGEMAEWARALLKPIGDAIQRGGGSGAGPADQEQDA